MDLDSIILKLGDFGKYQWFHNYLLCGLAALYTAPYCMSFMFTSLDLPYRCYIPECEDVDGPYQTHWLSDAIPSDPVTGLSKCERYHYENTSDMCTTLSFNRSKIETCSQWIYKYPHEQNIIGEFNLHCNENKWKLTSVGTLSIVARILGMPLTAFVSDRFGRRYVIIFGTILSCLFGTIKALSPNYESFLAFEVLDAFFATGFYNCAIVLAVELVSPKNRLWVTFIINGAYTIGDVLIGSVGYYFRYWRHFLLIIYLPGGLFISYFWIFPESVRWLVSQKRYKEAAKSIEKMARWNNVKLDFDVELILTKSKIVEENNGPQMSYLDTILEAAKSGTLMFRLAICSFCCTTCSFVWYGVTQQATLIEGDMYVNFIISALMQYPGNFLCILLSRFGRRKPLSACYLLCAAASLGSYLLPPDSVLVRVSMVMLTKLIISSAALILILLSAEMFPTELRHSMVAAVYMVGMIGQSFAPQIPLLATYYGRYFPMLVFAITNILAGIFCLLLPETSEVKLIDTIKEAKELLKAQKTYDHDDYLKSSRL